MSPTEVLKKHIADLQEEVMIYQKALAAIEGPTSMPADPSGPSTAPLRSDTPVMTERPAPSTVATKPTYTGPRCSCGGKMSQTAKIMRSGAYAAMWICNDSSCNNEMYA